LGANGGWVWGLEGADFEVSGRHGLTILESKVLKLLMKTQKTSIQEDIEVPHPRETTAFFGHADAEAELLAAYRSGRMPHAWLIGGPRGIGKATLAYRVARFVFCHPDPAAAAVQNATSLAVAPDHPVSRRMAAQAKPDLLILERTPTESGTLRQVITVEEVRRTISFFGTTAAEGGWRVCIVDAADELQFPQASNALLKVLEEPPARGLFLLISHFPGRLLPTIRSRCRRLEMRPLYPDDLGRATASALSRDVDDEIRAVAAAADGSVAHAAQLIQGSAMAVRQQVLDLLSALPALDPLALHVLGDMLGRSDGNAFMTFVDTLREWLAGQLADGRGEIARLARVAEVWEKLNRAARDVEVFNLEPRPMVFAVFGLLAETARP